MDTVEKNTAGSSAEACSVSGWLQRSGMSSASFGESGRSRARGGDTTLDFEGISSGAEEFPATTEVTGCGSPEESTAAAAVNTEEVA